MRSESDLQVIAGTITLATALAAVTRPTEQEEPLFTPLKLQYVAPKAFLTSAGLIPAPQFIQTTNQQLISPQQRSPADSNTVLPLTVLTVPPRVENYLTQERSNRLPPSSNLLPELQFADPRRVLPIISNSHAAALLNAAYQPGYVLMSMPPSSYTAVAYYDDLQNHQETTKQQSNTEQPLNDHPEVNSRSNNPQSNVNSDPHYSTETDIIQQYNPDKDSVYNARSNINQQISSRSNYFNSQPQNVQQSHSDNEPQINSRSNIVQLSYLDDDPQINSKANVKQRSNSDTVSASDSSSDFPDSTKTKVYSVSYKDKHVNYSY